MDIEEICEKFIENPNINPTTGKRIIKGRKTHQELENLCSEYIKNSSPPRNSPPRNSPPRNSPPRNSPPRNSPPRNSPPRNSLKKSSIHGEAINRKRPSRLQTGGKEDFRYVWRLNDCPP
jgi:hypothetical protein